MAVTARHQQVIGLQRQQATVRDGIPGARRKVIVAGAAARRVVDVDVIVAGGNFVRELGAGYQVFLCEHIFAHDFAAFAHADFPGGVYQLAVFKARHMLLEEMVHLKHLLARDHFSAGDVQGVNGVVLNHARGVEVQHAVHQGVEHQHIFARVGDLALGLELLVLVLHQLAAESGDIHIADAKHSVMGCTPSGPS